METVRNETIEYDDFERVELRVGTVTGVTPNIEARVAAYVLRIDLGPLGTKTSSAQVTQRYDATELLGRQVLCVCNLAPKRVAGVSSEVLVLGAYDEHHRVVLAAFDHQVPDGAWIS